MNKKKLIKVFNNMFFCEIFKLFSVDLIIIVNDIRALTFGINSLYNSHNSFFFKISLSDCIKVKYL